MECTMVKQPQRSSMLGLSQSTWNGSMHRFACLEAAPKFLLRKLGSQGVQSASPTREARPLTPHLARPNSNTAFAKAELAAKAVPSGSKIQDCRERKRCDTHCSSIIRK
jgi:hypothetical protein